MQLRIQDWPNMSKAQRSEYHRNIYRLAYPAVFREDESITLDQLSKLQNSGMI